MYRLKDPFNLVIGGVGGQGNILISRLIGRLLTAGGHIVSIGETFGAAQRGGAVFSSLRVSKTKYLGPLIPQGQANLIVGLEIMETFRLIEKLGNPEVLVLSSTAAVHPVDVLAGQCEYPPLDKLTKSIKKFSKRAWFIPATDVALELGSPIMANIVMLGALTASEVIPIDRKSVENELGKILPAGKLSLNLKAFEMGFQHID